VFGCEIAIFQFNYFIFCTSTARLCHVGQTFMGPFPLILVAANPIIHWFLCSFFSLQIQCL